MALSALQGSIATVKYGAETDPLSGISNCVIVSRVAAKQLYATFFAFAYVIPLAIIVTCSVGILRHVVRHKVPVTSALSGGRHSAVARGGRRRSCRTDRKRQVGRVLVLVVVMFAGSQRASERQRRVQHHMMSFRKRSHVRSALAASSHPSAGRVLWQDSRDTLLRGKHIV